MAQWNSRFLCRTITANAPRAPDSPSAATQLQIPSAALKALFTKWNARQEPKCQLFKHVDNRSALRAGPWQEGEAAATQTLAGVNLHIQRTRKPQISQQENSRL